MSDGFIQQYKNRFPGLIIEESDVNSRILRDISLRKEIAKDVINSINNSRPKELFDILDPIYKSIKDLNDNLGIIEIRASITKKDDIYKSILKNIEDGIISHLKRDSNFRMEVVKEIVEKSNKDVKFMSNHENLKPSSAFISYSHDDENHKQWVLKLCNDLSLQGIDVKFDQWNPIGSNVQRFMESCTEHDKVIIICTPNYVIKADAGKDGVGYEKAIITKEIIKDTNEDKYIPVIRKRTLSLESVPKFLGHAIHIDMSDDNGYDLNLERLVKKILGIDIEENLERKELAISKNILRKLLNSKKDSTINSNDDKTVELLDKVLQDLGNVRAYGHLDFSYLSRDMDESDIEEVKFIVDQLESMGLISVIRDKTISRYGNPFQINRIEAIFEKDIRFINIIKEQLKPVLQELPRGESMEADKILDYLNNIDKAKARNLVLFALKDFKLSGSIELYIDQFNMGVPPGDLKNSTIHKM